ncbi:uncharacterized protein LOC111341271 [Stylophora pistillata]|uniref:uncharacterized protein LOC111341271 n=1 Tax=Stylophora pistillata TaxID=50429 RepID=UPI000C03C4A6|nr:uncharacterized protein LOC111341271 [Stylophora pistillata]
MMVRATPVSLGNTKEGFCVVISIAKTDSGRNTAIFVREIDKDGLGVGEPFRLATSEFKHLWKNEEVEQEKIRFGSVVKYAQVGDEYLFRGNTKCQRQDVDKILLDLSFDDGVYRGIKDAFPEANIAPKGSKGIYQNCRPKQSLCLVSLKYGIIANERIRFKTKLGEHVNLKLNCRENLVLTTAPVRLQLSHASDDDVGEVALVNMREPEYGVRSPTYQAVCEGLILKLKPKEISIDEEPVEIEDEAGHLIMVPGNVTFDTGNTGGTAISNKLVDALGLKPDNTKKKKVTIPGDAALQCCTVPIKIKIRGRKFPVNALVGAVAPHTDLLIGMDIMQQLGDEGYSLQLA